MSRCPNCMNEMVQNACSNCGYPSVDTVQVRGALPCHTMLLNQLEIGNPLGQSYQSIAYIAYDLRTASAVIVTEFYPRQIVSRTGTDVTVRTNHELFREACRQYLTSSQTHPLTLINTFACNGTAYRVYQLSGHSALAARDAETLLDQPILFRNEQGTPLMSVNALVIPPMPAVRDWAPGEKIRHEYRRRKINRAVGASAVLLAVALGGVLGYDIVRKHDVTIRIQTGAPIVEAHLGHITLPAATPDEEGFVTYHAQLAKGHYTLDAVNEWDMHVDPQSLSIPAQMNYEAAIPSPSPTPLPAIVLQGDEWIYLTEGQYYIASDTLTSTTSQPDSSTTMATIHVTGTEGHALDRACSIVLCRSALETPLHFVDGTADFAVSEGEYELRLRCDQQESRLLTTFTATQEQTITLNTEAITFYCDYLCQLDASQPLFYVGDHASMTLDGTDAIGINRWANEYPALFDAYRQYVVNFQLDPHLSTQAQVTINGLEWKDGDVVTLCSSITSVDVVIATSNAIIPAETITVDPFSTEPVILGQQAVTLTADRWQDALGLMHIANEYYLLYEHGIRLLSSDDFASLQNDIQLSPQSFSFSVDELFPVTLELDSFVLAQQVQDVSLMGLVLAPEVASSAYALELTPGDYPLSVSFRNGAATQTETISVTANDRSFTLLTDETKRMLAMKNALADAGVTGLIRTAGGYAYLPGHSQIMVEDVSITAQQVAQYAQIYDVFGTSFTLYDVHIQVDSRLDPSMIQTLTLAGQNLNLSSISGTVDTLALTPGSYQVQALLNDNTMLSYPLEVTSESKIALTLLTETADAVMAQQRFWGAALEEMTLQQPDARLTESAVADAIANAEVWHVYVTGPEDVMQHTFFLTYTTLPDNTLQMRPVEIATMTDLDDTTTATDLAPLATPLLSADDDPVVESYVSTGMYSLHISYEGTLYCIGSYEIIEDTVIRLQPGDLSNVLPSPTPTATPESTAYHPHSHSTDPADSATPTASSTVTTKPTATISAKPTATPSATNSAKPTASATPTATVSSTPTPKPTEAPTDSSGSSDSGSSGSGSGSSDSGSSGSGSGSSDNGSSGSGSGSSDNGSSGSGSGSSDNGSSGSGSGSSDNGSSGSGSGSSDNGSSGSGSGETSTETDPPSGPPGNHGGHHP